MMNKNTAIEKIEHRQGLEVLGSADAMMIQLEEQSKRIQVVHEFVESNFVKGIDFGPADKRNDKETLLKPGAEKVCKLFNTRAVCEVDTDTLNALGNPPGTIAYKCSIISCSTGEVVGEGRGADTIGNKQRDANKAIKNAEKCAIVDAALWTFNLSGRFTQDDGGRKQTQFNDEKAELVAVVSDLRIGVDSSMTVNQFLYTVCKRHIQQPEPTTVGAIRAMRKAIIDDGLYDLATGDRIPD